MQCSGFRKSEGVGSYGRSAFGRLVQDGVASWITPWRRPGLKVSVNLFEELWQFSDLAYAIDFYQSFDIKSSAFELRQRFVLEAGAKE